MTLVILITTSLLLFDEHKPMTPITDVNVLQQRQERYMKCIDIILKQKLDEEMCIITENNGLRPTCLDHFVDTYPNVHIHYTNHQFLEHSCNKGRKELLDIQSACHTYNIPENAFVIKITGRYTLLDNSFLHRIREENDRYDVFYRQGSMFKPHETIQQRNKFDCVCGLIAFRCGFFTSIMKVNQVQEFIPIECLYAHNIHQYIIPSRQYVCETVGFQNDDLIV